ncbi:MAG TPA: L,D-transpeptidase family protein [Chryseosolibacter sp.]|nr:L,D-transpeptidase family protein [Chryseosolibacter sp.]
MKVPVIIAIALMVHPPSFKEQQLSKPRVKDAYAEKENVIRGYFASKDLVYGDFQLFIRAFKRERLLEAWIRPKNARRFTLLKTFPFCTSSGKPGPKRKEGDLQIPEGVYHLNHFNPESNFHLSLGVSYPNASDKIFSDKKAPGGAIYIHGNCVSIGCIPVTDDGIKELYILAVEAKNDGQQKIPIHIFPGRLDDAGLQTLLSESGTEHASFWTNLKPIFEDFERSGTLSDVVVDAKGLYSVVRTEGGQ